MTKELKKQVEKEAIELLTKDISDFIKYNSYRGIEYVRPYGSSMVVKFKNGETAKMTIGMWKPDLAVMDSISNKQPVEEKAGMKWGDLLEQARLAAEDLMAENWDRKDHIHIGVFYCHMLNFIAEHYESPSSPSEKEKLSIAVGLLQSVMTEYESKGQLLGFDINKIRETLKKLEQ
jgi:hypothetical protein